MKNIYLNEENSDSFYVTVDFYEDTAQLTIYYQEVEDAKYCINFMRYDYLNVYYEEEKSEFEIHLDYVSLIDDLTTYLIANEKELYSHIKHFTYEAVLPTNGSCEA